MTNGFDHWEPDGDPHWRKKRRRELLFIWGLLALFVLAIIASVVGWL